MEKKEWYSLSVNDVEKELSTNSDKGLSADEISKRKEQYGSNEITSKNGKPLWKMIVEQFTDFMIIACKRLFAHLRAPRRAPALKIYFTEIKALANFLLQSVAICCSLLHFVGKAKIDVVPLYQKRVLILNSE